MKGKYKLTRFARLVIFLALISPAAYMAGVHYQENPDFLDFKDNFSINLNFDDNQDESEIDLKDAEDFQEEIESLQEEIEELEIELKEKDFIIDELKNQSKEV